MQPLEAALQGAKRDRLHGRLDQPLAGRGVHPDPAHGRHRRPPVPRVRGDAVGRDRRLAGRLADDDADDVRAAAAGRTTSRSTAGSYRLERAGVRLDPVAATSDRCAGCCGTSAPRCWSTLATIGLTVYLYVIVPKGFFPQQDTGRLTGSIEADQDISFQAMQQRAARCVDIVIGEDPAVATRDRLHRGGGGGSATPARMFVTLKPLTSAKPTRRRRSSAACAASWPGAGRDLVLQAVAGPARSAGARAGAVPVHAAGRRPRRARRVGAAGAATQLRRLPGSPT